MAMIIFTGDKGGTGKSKAAQAFSDWSMVAGYPVHVVDADTRNPDVFRMFREHTKNECIDLRTENGWASLVDRCAASVDSTNVVLNVPAGIGDEDEKYGDIFMEACRDMNMPVVVFWVINRGVDSVNQLRRMLDRKVYAGAAAQICLCNQYFAPQGEAFDIWEKSQTKTLFEEAGGRTGSFPALTARAVSVVELDPKPFSVGIAQNMFGTWDTFSVKKWIGLNRALFDGLELPLVKGAAQAKTGTK